VTLHLAEGQIPLEYRRYIGRKMTFIVLASLALACLLLLSVSVGAADVPIFEVARALLGGSVSERFARIVWNIRLPQALAAVVAGAGLAVAGTVMQSVLRNPLGSPFTLGISHAAAFGAALSVMLLGGGVMTSSQTGAVTVTNQYLTTASAFGFSLVAVAVIMVVSRVRGATPEVMVLAGVATGSLFTAGTMFLQYFADDVQLSAMVFWTFGDTARASWTELSLLVLISLPATGYFLLNSWGYNAIDAGDETARGLGIHVGRVRLMGMVIASLVTAVLIAFLGIIGFVGLVVPHMVRHLIGGDHRFLLPASLVAGGIVLLAADTVARLILAPQVLPVSVLTAFLGAPVFLALIMKGHGR